MKWEVIIQYSVDTWYLSCMEEVGCWEGNLKQHLEGTLRRQGSKEAVTGAQLAAHSTKAFFQALQVSVLSDKNYITVKKCWWYSIYLSMFKVSKSNNSHYAHLMLCGLFAICVIWKTNFSSTTAVSGCMIATCSARSWPHCSRGRAPATTSCT